MNEFILLLAIYGSSSTYTFNTTVYHSFLHSTVILGNCKMPCNVLEDGDAAGHNTKSLPSWRLEVIRKREMISGSSQCSMSG